MQSFDPNSLFHYLAQLKDMPLIAKTIAEGFLQGIQPSVLKGAGIEFSQYRSYEAGDAPSLIDWKLYGRTDRYYIREAEKESDTVIWLVIDASRSMLMGEQSDGASQNKEQNINWHKLDFAKHLAAAIAYIGQKQGDSVGILALSSDELHCIPPAAGWQHWQKLMLQLSRVNSGGYFPSSDLIGHYCHQLQRPNLVFVISDFWQQDNEMIDFIAQISHQRNEVVAMQLQCLDEIQFDYQGVKRFKDLETGQSVLLEAKSVQAQYLAALDDYQDELERQLSPLNVPLHRYAIEQAFDQLLLDYLAARQSFAQSFSGYRRG